MSDDVGTPPSERTRIRREPHRARYDRETVLAILDAGLVAHVAIVDDGTPFVLPMTYAVVGDELVLHGSVASRLMRALKGGTPACATVTVIDGLRLARSAFHTSMAYRSVVVPGVARVVEDDAGRAAAFTAIMDRLLDGRYADARPPNDVELRQTLVVALPLTEAVAKVAAGAPGDDDEDRTGPWWAGEIPLRTVALTPVPAPDLPEGVAPPANVRGYRGPPGP